MPTEEERRRKIIIDSQVVSMAVKGIRACMDGTLTESQISRMIALDEEYLSRCEQIERNP
jgi:hypothetical protein